MGKRMGEYRRRKTQSNKVNGYKGRSQKGCFGGTPGFAASGMVYNKEFEQSGKTAKEYFKS